MKPKLPPCYCGCCNKSEIEIESLQHSFETISVSKDSMKEMGLHNNCSQSGSSSHAILKGRVSKRHQPSSIVSTFSSSLSRHHSAEDKKNGSDASPSSTNSAHSFVVDSSSSSYLDKQELNVNQNGEVSKRPKSLRTRRVGTLAPAPTPASPPPQSFGDSSIVNSFSSSEDSKDEEVTFPILVRRRRNAVCDSSALGRHLREYLMSYMLSSVTDQIESSLNLTHSQSHK